MFAPGGLSGGPAPLARVQRCRLCLQRVGSAWISSAWPLQGPQQPSRLVTAQLPFLSPELGRGGDAQPHLTNLIRHLGTSSSPNDVP